MSLRETPEETPDPALIELGLATIEIAKSTRAFVNAALDVNYPMVPGAEGERGAAILSIMMLLMSDTIAQLEPSPMGRIGALREIVAETAMYVANGSRLEDFRAPNARDPGVGGSPSPVRRTRLPEADASAA